MRLFYAILLSREIRDALIDTQERLREQGVQGNFTRPENLHLTLAFLGETGNLSGARRAGEALDIAPFSLCVKGLGSFRKGKSELLWAGVEPNSSLQQLQRMLSERLRQEGFLLENRSFQPHLTLAREAQVPASFDRKAFAASFSKKTMRISAVSLMKSERVRGILTYTELFPGRLILHGEGNS